MILPAGGEHKKATRIRKTRSATPRAPPPLGTGPPARPSARAGLTTSSQERRGGENTGQRGGGDRVHSLGPSHPMSIRLLRSLPAHVGHPQCGAVDGVRDNSLQSDTATAAGVPLSDAPKRHARCERDGGGRQAEVVELLLTPADRRSRNSLVLLRNVRVNARSRLGRLRQLRALRNTVLAVLLESTLHAEAASHRFATILTALFQSGCLWSGRADASRCIQDDTDEPEEEGEAASHQSTVNGAHLGAMGAA